MITHHISDDLLIEYANGSLPVAESLIVASHISMCSQCRDRVEQYEAVAAALLEDGETASTDDDALSAVFDRIEVAGAENAPAPIDLDRGTMTAVPPPLRTWLSGNLSDLDWQQAGRGVEEVRLESEEDTRVSLLRIRPGQKLPKHTHRGNEYTLVLTGGYSDGERHFGRGDVSIADDETDHSPIADAGEPCLCLVVQDNKVRLTGTVGRFLNPFVPG